MWGFCLGFLTPIRTTRPRRVWKASGESRRTASTQTRGLHRGFQILFSTACLNHTEQTVSTLSHFFCLSTYSLAATFIDGQTGSPVPRVPSETRCSTRGRWGGKRRPAQQVTPSQRTANRKGKSPSPCRPIFLSLPLRSSRQPHRWFSSLYSAFLGRRGN